MNSSTYEIVKKAIIQKKQIVAEYHGHNREMCPHVIGKKYGENQALFYQFGGTSSSGKNRSRLERKLAMHQN